METNCPPVGCLVEFHLYVKAIGKMAHGFGEHCPKCAHDTQIYNAISNMPGDAAEILNQCFYC